MSENQRKAAKAALKKIADAISENEGRARMLQKGEDAAARKASAISTDAKEANARINYSQAKAEAGYEGPTGWRSAGDYYGRKGKNVAGVEQRYGYKGFSPEDLHEGYARDHEGMGNVTPYWAKHMADEAKDVRARGERISVRRKGIEAQNDALRTQASDIAMTERQHFEKLMADMKARRGKGISTEYADNLMIQGRGTPPVDIVPRNTRQEGILAAGTIAAAGAAGAAGYWTRKKESDRGSQK